MISQPRVLSRSLNIANWAACGITLSQPRNITLLI